MPVWTVKDALRELEKAKAEGAAKLVVSRPVQDAEHVQQLFKLTLTVLASTDWAIQKLILGEARRSLTNMRLVKKPLINLCMTTAAAFSTLAALSESMASYIAIR